MTIWGVFAEGIGISFLEFESMSRKLGRCLEVLLI